MRWTYANCFVPDGSVGDLLLTEETAVAAAAPSGVRTEITDRLIAPGLAEEMNIAVWRLAYDWFLVQGDDPTQVDGISSGDLAGFEVAIALLMPAVRGVLTAGAALDRGRPDSFTTCMPTVGRETYQAFEALQCAAAEAAVRHRLSGRIPIDRLASASPANTILCEKYMQTRDVRPLVTQPRRTRSRDVVATVAINLMAELLGPRHSGSILVYEYNPTRAFAEQYTDGGVRRRLVRCRTARADLRQIPRRGDRLVLPPTVPARIAVPPETDHFSRIAGESRELFTERFRFVGVELWSLLEPRLHDVVRRYRAFAAHGGRTWRSALERHGVEAVLVPFDGPPEARLLVRVAQSMGIPTFVLNDGFKADDFSMEGMSTDYAFAWSESIADRYYSRRPPPRAEVTGNPKADLQRSRRKRERPPGKLDRVLIGSFTFSPIDLNCRRSDPETFLDSVLSGIRLSPAARGAHIRIKLHPADRSSPYGPILERFADLAVEIVSIGDVVDSFEDADLYITTYSTSLLEAIALGLPSIYYRVNDQRLHPPFSEDDFLDSRTARSPKQLADLLERPATWKLPAYEAREEWVARYLGPTDGRSTDRIAQAVVAAMRAYARRRR